MQTELHSCRSAQGCVMCLLSRIEIDFCSKLFLYMEEKDGLTPSIRPVRNSKVFKVQIHDRIKLGEARVHLFLSFHMR